MKPTFKSLFILALASSRLVAATGDVVITKEGSGSYTRSSLAAGANRLWTFDASGLPAAVSMGTGVPAALALSTNSGGGFVTATGTATLTGKTLNLTSNTLAATSAQLATAVTDETGSGALVFAGGNIGAATATTAAAANNSTNVATTAFVQGEIASQAVKLTGAQTVAGAKSFSGQMELTGQAATSGTSAMTRDLSDEAGMFTNSNISDLLPNDGGPFGPTSGTGSVGSGGNYSQFVLTGSTTASAWQRLNLGDENFAGYPFSGGNLSASQAFAVAFNVIINPAADANGCFTVGHLSGWNTAVPGPGSAALSDRGFCMRIYYSTTNSRYEVGLYSHDGTTYNTPVTAAIPISPGYSNRLSFIMSTNGAGTVRLYMANPVNTRISKTPILTLTGAPSSGAYPGYAGLWTFALSNNATPPGSAWSTILLGYPKIHIGQTNY